MWDAFNQNKVEEKKVVAECDDCGKDKKDQETSEDPNKPEQPEQPDKQPNEGEKPKCPEKLKNLLRKIVKHFGLSEGAVVLKVNANGQFEIYLKGQESFSICQAEKKSFYTSEPEKWINYFQRVMDKKEKGVSDAKQLFAKLPREAKKV